MAFNKNCALFGRNLDLEFHFDEKITVVPRNFPLEFQKIKSEKSHHAFIGMAYIQDEYPLFYDGMNEHGLFAAALNFPGNAVYNHEKDGFFNVASFELIPWILSSCSNLREATQKLEHANILSTDFSKSLSATPLHWLVADKTGAITVEPLENGLKITENPFGVLTNNPPFDFQMQNLSNFINLSPNEPKNRFCEEIEIKPYSRGMGAMGLPGDMSSASRFVRATFLKANAVFEKEEALSRFFQILGALEQIKGAVRLCEGKLEQTVYSSCADGEKGIYYYRTFGNSRISAVRMKLFDLDAKSLFCYPLLTNQDIFYQN